MLRAEVTWDDDFEPGNSDDQGHFFSAVLSLESNERRTDGSLATLAKRDIIISHEQALAILANPPEALLVDRANEFALLRTEVGQE